MSTVKKASVKEKPYNVVVNDKVRSYADEPFFIKKEEKAKEFLRKHPIPEYLKK
ncbi:hypothetical protein [Mucilaginibacter sp.]|uniref:hypothetical protein n=1 Tax=Mucilaginibacter sp. TaxID=1882438 RepID=UPI0028460D84|nr:hypothetical protein [Mucilaginibacter sp.]MDR3693490.1 hypothetical protein [Mucilaginibacter sp.]